MNSIDWSQEKQYLEPILFKIGLLFQIHNDYMDCWADPQQTGKQGSDIEEGKCCWPIVKALEICDGKQLNISIENYGSTDKQCVEKVKSVYNELNLIHVYHKEVKALESEIETDLNSYKNNSGEYYQIIEYFSHKICKNYIQFSFN